MLIDGFVGGTAEGDELLRDDPIQVAVLYAFVVLVLGQVEGLVVEPAQLDGVLQPAEAVEQLSVILLTVHL